MINRILANLNKLETISSDLYNRLLASGSSPGILYGTAKIPKPNLPICPILAAYNTSIIQARQFFGENIGVMCS